MEVKNKNNNATYMGYKNLSPLLVAILKRSDEDFRIFLENLRSPNRKRLTEEEAKNLKDRFYGKCKEYGIK